MESMKVQVVSYKVLDQNNVCYQIQICQTSDDQVQQKRFIEKSYDEFCSLDYSLRQLVPNVPILPEKYLFKLQNPQQLKKRQTDLNKYIHMLSFKPDVKNCSIFHNFLQLTNQEVNIILDNRYSPKIIDKIEYLNQPIVNCFYQSENKKLVLVTSNKISKIGSIVNFMTQNVFMNYSKKTNQKEQDNCKSKKVMNSQVLFYEYDQFDQYINVFKKQFQFACTASFYNLQNQLLFVGFENGSIEIYEFKDQNLNHICSFKKHYQPVTDIGFYISQSIMISLSDDKSVLYHQIDCKFQNNFQILEKNFTNCLKQLKIDQQNKRCFISDSNKTIYVMACESPHNILTEIVNKYKIQHFDIDHQQRFILILSKQNQICIYDLNKPGKEKFINYVNQIDVQNEKVSTFGKQSQMSQNVRLNLGQKLVYVDYNGSINVIQAQTGQSIDSLQISQNSIISSFQYFHEYNQIVVQFRDHSIAVVVLDQEQFNQLQNDRKQKHKMHVLNQTHDIHINPTDHIEPIQQCDPNHNSTEDNQPQPQPQYESSSSSESDIQGWDQSNI